MMMMVMAMMMMVTWRIQSSSGWTSKCHDCFMAVSLFVFQDWSKFCHHLTQEWWWWQCIGWRAAVLEWRKSKCNHCFVCLLAKPLLTQLAPSSLFLPPSWFFMLFSCYSLLVPLPVAWCSPLLIDCYFFLCSWTLNLFFLLGVCFTILINHNITSNWKLIYLEKTRIVNYW